jgi:hypothetical protein
MTAELYDGGGYPTDAAIERLQSFEGAAGEMVDYVRSLMRNGGTKLEDFQDDFDRRQKRLTLVTCGWSGCESVISALDETMFHFMFWESSFRGGLHTYTLSPKQWFIRTEWGKP